jgi:hypothetical protein
MPDQKKFTSGETLLEALKGGELSSQNVHTGMIRASEKEDHVAFAPASCDQWIDIPAELIGEVEVLRQLPCREHSHPLARIELKVDESNPVQARVPQFLTSVASRAAAATPRPLAAVSSNGSAWGGATPYSGGPQGLQLRPPESST